MITNAPANDGEKINVLDRIKAEPKIKTILTISKILKWGPVVLEILAVGIILLQIFVFKTITFKMMQNWLAILWQVKFSILLTVLSFIVMLAQSILELYADVLINKRLDAKAVENGVADKRPNGKDVRRWKLLVNLCAVAMLIFCVATLICISINRNIALAFLLGMVACAVGSRAFRKKQEDAQDLRIKNIIYAEATKKAEEDNAKTEVNKSAAMEIAAAGVNGEQNNGGNL